MYINKTKVSLLDGIYQHRSNLNRDYLMSLKNKNLLQNHYLEAGFWTPWGEPEDCHGGWEYPTSAVKGQFLGHWMSAAAHLCYYQNDREARAKLNVIIDELEKCQLANGGEWINSQPEKYLLWGLEGRLVGVPHYVIHKTMLGLWDSYEFAGSQKALDILLQFANYFVRWVEGLTEDQMDDLLDLETGGMMEIFANLYGLTQNLEHKKLMERYERKRLTTPLLAGEDVLSNKHANTTVPEILGVAKAYEVTGNEQYLKKVLAYWDMAVTKRGYYATGSANSGEIWCPPGDFASRLGIKTQEHCTQYNMIRLAEFLFRHTENVVYADFIERSICNSIFAGQNPETGMIAYYLPLAPGSKKEWGTPTQTFWCCHGSLVQVHTQYPKYICYTGEKGLVISQFIPAVLEVEYEGTPIRLTLTLDSQGGHSQSLKSLQATPFNKPSSIKYHLEVSCENKEFEIKIRKPWWVKKVNAQVNGKQISPIEENGFLSFKNQWLQDKITLEFEKEIQCVQMPGDENLMAFMDGPFVLAGLCEHEKTLTGNHQNPSSMFRPIDAKHWMQWRSELITTSQKENIRFLPLSEITDQVYTVYFKIGE